MSAHVLLDLAIKEMVKRDKMRALYEYYALTISQTIFLFVMTSFHYHSNLIWKYS